MTTTMHYQWWRLKQDKSTPPYIYQQYTVKCFTSSPSTKTESVPAGMVNSIVKALNDAHKLPRFIIIIPDWDLLHYSDHNTYGVEAVTQWAVGWMVSNIIKAIEMRKDQIYNSKRGAVVATEPKVVWVKMLQRMRSYDKILTVRSKFNSTVETLIANKWRHYIIDINPILCDVAYFTKTNQLTGEGIILFWKEINECIKLFDACKLQLMPCKDILWDEHTDSAAQLKFKMPLLPPLEVGRDKSHKTPFHQDRRQDHPHHFVETVNCRGTNQNTRARANSDMNIN